MLCYVVMVSTKTCDILLYVAWYVTILHYALLYWTMLYPGRLEYIMLYLIMLFSILHHITLIISYSAKSCCTSYYNARDYIIPLDIELY